MPLLFSTAKLISRICQCSRMVYWGRKFMLGMDSQNQGLLFKVFFIIFFFDFFFI